MSRQFEAEGVGNTTPSKSDEIKYSVEDDRSRVSVYGLLAKLFDAPPTAAMFHELRTVGFFAPSSELVKETGEHSLKFDSERLHTEYTRLFLGPGKHVSPFASVYRSDDTRSGSLWGNTTGEVKRFMEHYGLLLTNPGAVPDHIAILFEFMEKVIRAKIDRSKPSIRGSERETAAAEATKIEKQFFNTYISSWVDEFLEAMERVDPAPFYHILLEQTRDFVEEERDRLKT